MRIHAWRLIIIAAAILLAMPAVADDWNVTRQRGDVFQLFAGSWRPLHRGNIVQDDRVIRTGAHGHVTLVRGKETIELRPNTEIRIVDSGGAKPYTTIQQAFGTVSVEAEVRQVEHFAVQNMYLAAVVKGTRFTVTTGTTGASVTVQRGHVAVERKRDRTHVTIGSGQSATIETAESDGALEVKGKGKLPVVLDRKGKPVPLAPVPNGKPPKATPPLADPKAKPPTPQPSVGTVGPGKVKPPKPPKLKPAPPLPKKRP